MNINVHIERLILDGLPVKGSDGSIIQAAVETELSRLLGEQGLAGMTTGAASASFSQVEGFSTTSS